MRIPHALLRLIPYIPEPERLLLGEPLPLMLTPVRAAVMAAMAALNSCEQRNTQQ
jgi:hypothetical protein